MADAEAVKEVAKTVESAPWSVLAAGASGLMLAAAAALRRRGSLAKRALEIAEHAKEKADAQEIIIKKVNIRTRVLKRNVQELAKTVLRNAESVEANQVEIKATLTSIQSQQTATYTEVVSEKARRDERNKMRQEHVMRTRSTDPRTPFPEEFKE